MKTFTAVAKINPARYFCDTIVQVHVYVNVIVFGKNSLLQIELSCYNFNIIIICFSLSLARQFIPSLRLRVNRWMISEWLSMWVLVHVRVQYSLKFSPTSSPTPTTTNDRVFYHCLLVLYRFFTTLYWDSILYQRKNTAKSLVTYIPSSHCMKVHIIHVCVKNILQICFRS